jgi:hypothetical protein
LTTNRPFFATEPDRHLPTNANSGRIRGDLFSSGYQPDAQAERDPQSKLQKSISMAQTIEIRKPGGALVSGITFDENLMDRGTNST